MVRIHVFDKTFSHSTSLYGYYRCQTELQCQEVSKNNQAVRSYLGVERLVFLKQVHGTQIVDVDFFEDSDWSQEREADAVLTTRAGVALAIQTADCVPVLLWSEETLETSDRTLIAAAHCGWRGAQAGILSSLIGQMRQRGAKKIAAFLGPAIYPKNYEVDASFYLRTLQNKQSDQAFFSPSTREAHWLFDLPGYVYSQLRDEGLSSIQTEACQDTYASSYLYWSHRREVHLGVQGPRRSNLSTIFFTRPFLKK